MFGSWPKCLLGRFRRGKARVLAGTLWLRWQAFMAHFLKQPRQVDGQAQRFRAMPGNLDLTFLHEPIEGRARDADKLHDLGGRIGQLAKAEDDGVNGRERLWTGHWG